MALGPHLRRHGDGLPVRTRSHGELVGIVLPEPSAVTDFRTTYGGFQLAFPGFLAWCAAATERVRIGLVATAAALAGFVGGRLVGLTLDGPPRPIIYVLLAAEIAGIAIALVGLRRTASPT